MNWKKTSSIGIAVLVISLIVGLGAGVASAQNTGFTDGFESDSVGNLPNDWVANGNSNQQVTDARSASGDNSFRITGSSGGCWEAIANRPVDLPSSGSVEISAKVMPTDNGQPGCHGYRNSLMHLRTTATGWGDGSSTNLWQTRSNGTFIAQGSVSGLYDVNQWNDVSVVYERSGGQVDLSYSLNGRNIASTTRQVRSYEDDLSYLTFNSGEYELFIDDVSVSSQNTNDRFEPNDDISSAEPISPGSYSDLQIENGETDYFAVNLSQGDEITASIQFDHDDADVDLELLDPDRNQLDGSYSISDNEEVSATAQQSGTHYVEVYGLGGASAPYSLDISVSRNVVDDPTYSSDTGHYYQYVDSNDITWQEARQEASSRTYQGMQGYLATVTTQSEHEVIEPLIQGDAWLGGSDAATEGTWRWVTGPEGREDGGDGRQFFSASSFGGGSPVGGNFENFASGEPNNLNGNEDYLHYWGPSNNKSGSWNDNQGDSQLDGYVVEYGSDSVPPGGNGSVGDLDVSVTQTDGSGFPQIEAFVSARDAAGNALTNLDITNFEATEDGTSVQIDNIERVGTGGVDASTALVLDRSGSMKGFGTDAEDRLEEAATQFVSQFNRGDEAEIINFADLIRTEQRWTSNVSELESAIGQSVSDDDFTKLYDATVEGIRSAGSRQGRSAVIAITDGANNAGNIRDHQEVIEVAQQNNVPVYTIGLGVSGSVFSFSDNGTSAKPATNGTEPVTMNTESELREIATETGGQYYNAPDSSELTQIYQDISESISNEYRLTYDTPNPQEDGTQRTVEVEVTESGETGTDTGSYVAPNTTPPEIPNQDIENDIEVNGQTVEFDASAAFDPDGTITEYRWDFTNDGVVDANGEVVVHTYNDTGVYEVKLIVIDDSGVRQQEVFDVDVGARQGGNANIISVSPIPSDGQFTISYNVSGGNGHQVELSPSGPSVNVTGYSGNDDFSNLDSTPAETDSRLNPNGVALFDSFETGRHTITVDVSGGTVGDSVGIEVSSLQDQTVLDTDRRTVSITDEHPSGVSQALFDAVAEQNADPDTIQRSDVTDMIDAFFTAGELDGIPINRSDVTNIIDWFFRN